MADDNDATVSPVGAVRRQIRLQHPEIELYDADESHPTLAGTYVSAATFYTVVYRNDPTLITYNTSILTATVANQIKAIVKEVVFDNLSEWNVGAHDPAATFTFAATGNTYTFTNTSVNADSYEWNFGDGTATSTEPNPVHEFAGEGPYNVTLTATNCSRQSQVTQQIVLLSTAQHSVNRLTAYPNPSNTQWNISSTNAIIDSIVVTDMTGKTVMTVSPENNAAILDATHLSSGIYSAKIHAANAVETVKLVKN